MREMKDSGIEWIGEIPKEWEINKIGSVYDKRSVKVSDKDYPPLSVTKQGIVPQLETAAKTDNGDNRKLIKKNDFVINSRSDRRGSCGISEYDGSCSLINTVMKPRKNMCNSYYSFVFRSERFADEFYRWGTGIVDDLWSTKWSNMKNIYIPFPTLEEQQKISAYLNTKCTKIDSIIEKQEKVIEKLKAYKLSVITEAVTKGLNPDVKMKDSGVEWIGEIPEHWNTAKIKYNFKIISGATPKSEKVEYWNGEINWITPADFKTDDVYIDNGRKSITKAGYDSCGATLVPANSIIFSKRAPIGNVVISSDILCTNQGCLACISKKEVSIKYFYFTMSAFTEQFNLYGTGTTFKEISTKDFSNFILPLPQLNEQKQIADYLDKKCSAIDSAIEQKQAIIEKLKEYKKSLIYEVVTGKKEV